MENIYEVLYMVVDAAIDEPELRERNILFRSSFNSIAVIYEELNEFFVANKIEVEEIFEIKKLGMVVNKDSMIGKEE